MKNSFLLFILCLFVITTQVQAQNGANKSKAYAVKSKTHASKSHSRAHGRAMHKARRK